MICRRATWRLPTRACRRRSTASNGYACAASRRRRGAGPAPAGSAAANGAGAPPAAVRALSDTLHVDGNFSRGISQPLINALNALVTKDDQIAVMTPEMNVRDLNFSSRTVSIEAMLQRSWGRRDSPFELTPEEAEFAACYRGNPFDAVNDEGIAQEMMLRRREQRSLEALRTLVEHLGTVQRGRRRQPPAETEHPGGWNAMM